MGMTHSLLLDLVKSGCVVPKELEPGCRAAIGLGIGLSQSTFRVQYVF
jgi:hypothetical protein